MEYSVTRRKNFLIRIWNRCQSFTHNRNKKAAVGGLEGCCPVYVGPNKQKFTLKMKHVNHPLFLMLLEEAVTEYGYNSNGPILLPCDVDLFYKVLTEMEAKDHVKSLGSFVYGSCSPLNPSSRLGSNSADRVGKGYGSFEPLIHSRCIKVN
ncbi:indole-3-acetic acid-induced protein ARG7-like [Bidens hawaiensis]|uniref:indole-3-acetic acid-induced protein ARG7-like n=1 Tax=Bidens hawaiensis TaxID=980011 RepID=UPI0040493215